MSARSAFAAGAAGSVLESGLMALVRAAGVPSVSCGGGRTGRREPLRDGLRLRGEVAYEAFVGETYGRLRRRQA